jgi:CubicO group peptidase (beta-lactamase class C family)
MIARHTPLDPAGTCNPGFHRVRDLFHRNFKDGREVGAALCICVEGEVVVDLWAGWTDARKKAFWRHDTLATIYSCTKGLAALCALRLVDQGKLELNAPVAAYWPAFAQHGKESITLRQVLGHRAGLPAIRGALPEAALQDVTIVERHLEQTRPWWQPGTAHGYHALTIGWLLGRLVRNVSGKSLGNYFADEIARPLGLDIHIGLPMAEAHRLSRPAFSRALLTPHADVAKLAYGILRDGRDAMAIRAFTNPRHLGMHAAKVSHDWHQNEHPAANGMATARDLARLFAILAQGGTDKNGYRVLSRETLSLCWDEQSAGHDRILKRPTRFSHGFMMGQADPLASFGPGPRNFGHTGLGGTLTVADPDQKAGFAYVTNRLGNYLLVDPRARDMLALFYRCL